MKKWLILFAALGLGVSAQANYVNSGKSNFATAASTSCVPNGGGVTSGNNIVIGVQRNTATSVTIASTRVPVWTLDTTGCCNVDLYHGVATSSGAETIVATFTSGTALIGSVCGEYTTPSFNTSSFTGTVSSLSGDVIAVGTACCFAISTNAPFTQRQAAASGGTDFLALADYLPGAPGTYTVSWNNAVNGYMLAFVSAKKVHHSQLIRYRPPQIVRNKWLYL
jgi:hypothetical protein